MLCHSSVLTWSATALGSAVATAIMILAAFVEFSYIPTTRNNSSHLTRRLLLLLFTLALTVGPTFYIATVRISRAADPSLSFSVLPAFFISTGATLLFGIMPSVGCLSIGSRASPASTSRLITFTASYPILLCQACPGNIFLRFLAFGCKFTKSYFSQTTNATSCVTSRMSRWR
jgi:1,3-beta-glucan synthase